MARRPVGQISAKLRSVKHGGRPGIAWWCPGCEEPHQVCVDAQKGWKWDGNVDAPTLHPSVKVTGFEKLTEDEYQRVMAGERIEPRPFCCHAIITAGRIRFEPDSTHALAGQTVDLPDLPEHLND